MRIIAGSCKGRRLHTLKGNNTRPTADRVKEALFSVLAPYLPGARVLDAFAGSGALGLEALSRGAAEAWFCEHSRTAAQVCAKNIEQCAFNQAHLLIGDVLHLLPRLHEDKPGLAFDLIFLDPPYRGDLLVRAVEVIKQQRLLADEGMLIAETAADTPQLSLPGCQLQKEKKYGDTMLRFYYLTDTSK